MDYSQLSVLAKYALLMLTISFVFRLISWVRRIFVLRKSMPVIPTLFPPNSYFRGLWPKKWQTFHVDWNMQQKRALYQQLGSENFALVCFFEHDVVYLTEPDAVYNLNIEMADQFLKDMRVFGKAQPPLILFAVYALITKFGVYGPNVATTLGEEWKLHRRITSRTFSEKNNQLVMLETINQTMQMMASWERRGDGNVLVIEDVRNETMKIALHVICGAGYGYFFNWESSETKHHASNPLTTDSSEEIVRGHQLSFLESMQWVLDNLITLITIPRAFLHFGATKHLRTSALAYTEFGEYLMSLVQLGKNRQDDKNRKAVNSILDALVASSEEVEGHFRERLTEDEIVGNAFIFLLAGHETTANALLFAFYLLAINLESQEMFVNEVNSICGDQLPEFKHLPELVYGLCIMYEIMRLFPVLSTLPRKSGKDCFLQGKYLIPKGTSIGPDLINLHRNPKYWGPDYNEFHPSRFDNRGKGDQGWHPIMDGKLRIPSKGAFIPFGEGPRNCLGESHNFITVHCKAENNVGRRFAEVEFVTCLALVLQKWRIKLVDGWDKERVFKVLDASVQYATIRPSSKIPIVLRKR